MARFDGPIRSKPTDPAIAEKRARQQRELRYALVLSMLDEKPEVRRAIHTHIEPTGECIITIAIRDLGAVELEIPRAKWDSWNLINALNNHGGDIADE